MTNEIPLDKTQILLKVLEMQDDGLTRASEREQQIFQWSSTMLLAVFAGIVTLATASDRKALPLMAKPLISLVILIPVILSIIWIFRCRKKAMEYARVFEKIEEILHLFEAGYYGPASLLPAHWSGQLVKTIRKSKTPVYYTVILLFLAICVIVSIWLFM